MKILMIGNSFCYYYTRELHGIAKAAGIPLKICNVYYSGCSVKRHREWYKNAEARYQFFTTDDDGRRMIKSVDLRYCMAEEAKWDAITLQGSSSVFGEVKTVEEGVEALADDMDFMLSMLKKRFPESRYLWHHTWANQVGFQGPLGKDPATVPEYRKVLTKEKQTESYQKIRGISMGVCERFGLDRIPSGDAWQHARNDSAVGDVLCGKNGNLQGDFYHDGDIGGGRYLNACVWFEVLTQKSCLENTWRPDYELSEEKIAALQKAAHRAVAEAYGEGYAR